MWPIVKKNLDVNVMKPMGFSRETMEYLSVLSEYGKSVLYSLLMHLISQFNYLHILRHESFFAKLMNWICITNHHHLAHMEFSHLLTHSSLTHLEVYLIVSPGFFYLLVCIFLLFSVICYGAFALYVATNLLYSCILSKTGVIFSSFAISVFVL